MKKIDGRQVFAIALAIALMGGATLYAILFPPKAEPPLECTSEYVHRVGETDCENIMKGYDRESEAASERNAR